jgi:hypothetical protein
MLRLWFALLLATLLALPIVGAGCQESTIRALPNRAPIANALIDNGDDNTAQQRLGYVIKGQAAALDGTLSDDPDDSGLPYLLTFFWTFDSLPADSEMTDDDIDVPEDDPETEELNESAKPTFQPDVLGTYRISLIVMDDDGAESVPAIAVIQAVPPSDLSVHLEWDATQADLDLHLISPDGVYFDATGDCFSWNPNPDWGDADLAVDNPELGADDDGEGSGPYRETINLEEPPPGEYDVWVHYYSDHAVAMGHDPVPATASVEVRVFDTLVSDGADLTSDPLMEGDVWKVGVLSWPDRTWTPLNAMSDHAAEGGPDYNN